MPNKRDLISVTGSERATTGPGNNIVTRDGKTHVVWQDADATGYWAKARTLDLASGQWSSVTTIGPGKDNHARPCVTIDSKGVLHVIIGGHGTTCAYYASQNAHDTSSWTAGENVGEGTYPMIICGADDTLALTYRDRKLLGVELWIKPVSAAWQRQGFIFVKDPKYNTGYAGYNGAIAFGADGKTIHFSADVYEGVGYHDHRGTHQAVIYACSSDLGLTWKKSDGSAIKKDPLPQELDLIFRLDDGENAPSRRPICRNGGVATDAKGKPFVYLSQVIDGRGVPRLVFADGKGGWTDTNLSTAFFAKWPTMQVREARGHLTRTQDGALHVMTVFMPPREEEPIGRSGSNISSAPPAFGVGLLTTRDGGATFDARELIAHTPGQLCNQASVERPVGAQSMQGLPSFIWTEGEVRYPAKGEVINTKVWWMNA